MSNVETSIYHVLKNIELISSESISILNWELAFELTSGIDENDTPFVATAHGIEG